MTKAQLEQIESAYVTTWKVLQGVIKSNNRPLIFDLSAAVGALRTILQRELTPKPNEHKQAKNE